MRLSLAVTLGWIALAQAGMASQAEGPAGQPADVAPSAYCFRADRAPGENPPETGFLFSALGHPKPDVLCGLLWEAPRPIQRVELTWPPGATPPRPDRIALRWLPHGDSSSWWSRRPASGGKLDAATLQECRVSADGRTYVYAVEALRLERAMDHLVVIRTGGGPAAAPFPVPAIRAITPETWKPIDAEIEWGFLPGKEALAYDGQIETYNGILGKAAPLVGDAGTTLSGGQAWRSKPGGSSRRGIAVRLFYLGTTQNTARWPQHARVEHANRTIVTVRTVAGVVSFLPADLETGPIFAPEHGFFVRAIGQTVSPKPPQTSPARDLLSEKVNALAGNPAVRGWGSNDTPWFGANPARNPVTASTFTLPARSVAMHPAPGRPVAVAWRSPIQGRVAVRAAVADGDPSGGNGIEWSLVREGNGPPQVVALGGIDNGRSQSIPPAGERPRELAVDRGEFVSLVVAAKDADHSCDTTVIELVLTELGGDGRTWDLTKDVVGSLQEGNPHADSHGHPAVWHFLSPDRETDTTPVVMPSEARGAREFVQELASRNLRTIRQRVREREEQTWEGAMQAMHPGGKWPPYPQPDFEPPARIDVPDRRLADAWRCGAWHLLRVLKKDAQGRYVMRDYPYDALAHESFLILRALDLQGMHGPARDGLARWLQVDPNAAAPLDGLFSDAIGALSGVEWDWQHVGGPGLMHWQMVEHYLLTGDKEWFAQADPKLRANADWMIRQRRAWPKEAALRDRLWTRGLLPPHNIWDSTNWRPWYESNANYWAGLHHYAQTLAEIDPQAGRKYLAEAEGYAKDILAAADRSFALSPVVRVRDGTYRSFLPPAPYLRGAASRFMPTSFGSPEHTPGLYPDAIRGGVHLIHLSGLLPARDPRAQGLVDALEDRMLLEHHRLPMRTPGYDPEKHWFSHAGWYYQCGIERTADVHLQWDDVPNFLRSFYNQYAVDIVVGPYTFNEHTTRGPPDKSFEEAAFLERLRNLLVMEEADTLWLARATPRAWLKQGGKIAVRDMPSHFGPVAYEIVSDADRGKLAATVRLPSRKPPQRVLLRLRHPAAAKLNSVTVDGKAWTDFDPGREVISLRGAVSPVRIEATYAEGPPR